MKTVTLAMPVYNVAKFVEASLLSALNQTYQDIEFLIVDDKSTDNSMDIVRAVVNAHPRRNHVRIIDHVVNKGLGDTRNTSIDNASGEYIYFMDSDDVIEPDCIERLVKYMQETPVDFIAASRERKTFDGKLIAKDIYSPVTVEDNGELTVAKLRYVDNVRILGEVWNKLYSLDFLRRNHVGCIPGVHVEDVSFSYQVNLAARSCRLVPDVTYTYHIYEGQSFAAFQNNRDRALYLADCFRKIRIKDCGVAEKHRRNDIYGALLSGIYNVTLLHSSMIRKATALTEGDKKEIFRDLLRYDLSLREVLRLKTNRIKNFLYYIISVIPYSAQKQLLKLIYRK